MKFAFILLTAALSSNVAIARSLPDCRPIYTTNHERLHCAVGDSFYDVVIYTLTTPAAGCVMPPIPAQEARLRILNKDGKVVGRQTFVDFTYEVSAGPDRYSFKAPGLELNNCLMPLPAGFSVGN